MTFATDHLTISNIRITVKTLPSDPFLPSFFFPLFFSPCPRPEIWPYVEVISN